jgi:hypothetical protein
LNGLLHAMRHPQRRQHHSLHKLRCTHPNRTSAGASTTWSKQTLHETLGMGKLGGTTRLPSEKRSLRSSSSRHGNNPAWLKRIPSRSIQREHPLGCLDHNCHRNRDYRHWRSSEKPMETLATTLTYPFNSSRTSCGGGIVFEILLFTSQKELY